MVFRDQSPDDLQGDRGPSILIKLSNIERTSRPVSSSVRSWLNTESLPPALSAVSIPVLHRLLQAGGVKAKMSKENSHE
jgi:hypothetical protein